MPESLRGVSFILCVFHTSARTCKTARVEAPTACCAYLSRFVSAVLSVHSCAGVILSFTRATSKACRQTIFLYGSNSDHGGARTYNLRCRRLQTDSDNPLACIPHTTAWTACMAWPAKGRSGHPCICMHAKTAGLLQAELGLHQDSHEQHQGNASA